MKQFITILTLLFLSSNSFASTDADVKNFVNKVGKSIVSTAKQKNLSEKEKQTKIILIIDEAIDSDWIARFVLAKNYKNASKAQKDRFSKLYRQFMINTYGPKFQKYDGKKFEVTEVSQQKRFYIAKAEFIPSNSSAPINVNFRVKERNNKLVILDFIAEGVSLIETQRSEFNSAISNLGMDSFLDSLQTRVEVLAKNL